MKKLIYILSAGLLVLAVSCRQQETPYVPGEPEVDGCYGVFFPDQEAATTHYFSPTEEKTVELTIKRTNAEGAIDVPIVLVGENTSVYTAPETVHFDNAQEETTFTVSLNNTAEEVVDYPVTVEIQDPKFAHKYSTNNAFIEFSTMIVVWKEMGTFEVVEDGYWGEGFTTDIIYYEVDGIRYCKTGNYRDRHALGDGGISEDGGFWGTSPDLDLHFEWYLDYQDENGNDYVGLPLNDMGYPHASYGTRYYADEFHAYKYLWNPARFETYNTLADYLKANPKPDVLMGYYDPKGELVFNVECAVAAGSFKSFVLRLWKDDFVPVDYSLSIETGVSVDGVLPVYLTTGVDVASVSYVVYEGRLGKAVIGDHVAAIAKGEEEASTFTISDPEDISVLEVSLEETGEYTIILLPANAEGVLQPDNYASASFGFLAPGDENPVAGNAGLDTLSGKYIPKGYDPETALEAWVYGTDIITAHIDVYTTKEYEEDPEKAEQDVKAEGYVITGEELEALNGEGFSVVVTSLFPGTPYTLIAYLSNGYEEKWIISEATTKGEPDPFAVDWTSANFNAPVDKATFISKKWDLYGKALGREGYAKERAKVGEVTAKDGGVVAGDDIVELSGMSLGAGAYYNFDETFIMDVYNGILYSHYREIGNVSIGGKNYFMDIEFREKAAGEIYSNNYCLVGAYVMKGMIALVAYPRYISDYGFTFDGYEYSAWTNATADAEYVGAIVGLKDVLFVDPDEFETEEEATTAIANIQCKIDALKQKPRAFWDDVVKGKVGIGNRSHRFSEQIPFTGKAADAKVTVSTAKKSVKEPARYEESRLIAK